MKNKTENSKQVYRLYWELFSTFFRIGMFTIGGGYVMLPMIQREVVEVKKWATDEEVIDYYAIGQSTPGIIAINTATFIGFKLKGILGAIVATTGMVTPSLIIIISIAGFFQKFQENIIIKNAFGGIRIAVVALILNAVIKMLKKSVVDWIGIFIALLSFILVAFLEISPIVIIMLSALVGIILKFRGEINN